MECQFDKNPAELGRTKYVVILVSDGCPDPQCTVGQGNDFDPITGAANPLCEDGDFINCLLKTDCGLEFPNVRSKSYVKFPRYSHHVFSAIVETRKPLQLGYTRTTYATLSWFWMF